MKNGVLMRRLPSVKKLAAVIFDLDGVVVGSNRLHFLTFNKVLLRFGAQVGKKFWRENCTGTGPFAVFEQAFARKGIDEDVPSFVEERAALYRSEVKKGKLRPIAGFPKFHAFLQKNRIRTIIASGEQRKTVAASLGAVGFPKLPFVCIDDVKRGKPAPDLFLLAARKLGARPSECAVFEDAPAGIKAASRAGMPCVALSTTVPRSMLKGKAALVVKDFNSPALKKMFLNLTRKS